MEVVDLIRRDRRSLEYRESSMRENGLMLLPGRPVNTSHIAVIGRARAPGEPIALIVGTHAVKPAAACQFSLEVINAR